MEPEKKLKAFTRLLNYILGRNPWEFGLAPDPEGYVAIKELLKAINEEEDLSHIRRAHIDELIVTLSPPPVEIKDAFIRAVDRTHLPQPNIPRSLPKLLYTPIRKKAYPHVAEQGIRPSSGYQVTLTDDPDMARRIGSRRGDTPVILNVNVAQAEREGVLFTQYGDIIYLAKFIPPGCFSGPPIPKTGKPSPGSQKNKVPKPDNHDHFISGETIISPLKSRKDKVSWKNNKKKIRRWKEKQWPE